MTRREWTLLFIDSAQQLREYRYPRAVVQTSIAVVPLFAFLFLS
jgi:hypothetical protein